MHAACDRFGKMGYGMTTNRDIAKQAGVTAAALYQYFDSKCELYLATIRDAHEQIVPVFREAARSAPTARAALRNLVLVHATMHRRAPALAPLLSALPVEMQRHREISAIMMHTPNEVLALIRETVERGVTNGEIAPSMASAVVLMYLSSMMGLSLYAALLGSAGLFAAVDAYAQLFEGKLFSPPRRSRPTTVEAKIPPLPTKRKRPAARR